MFRQSAFRRLPRPTTTTLPPVPVPVPVRVRVHVPRRTVFARGGRESRSGRAVEGLNIQRLTQQSEEYHRNRRMFLWCGTIAGLVSFGYTAYKLTVELSKKPAKLDSGLPSTDPLVAPNAADRKVVVHDADGREMVPTGNSTVPTFPRTLDLPSYAAPIATPSPDAASLPITQTIATPSGGTTEYTLVGLGLRTVTFINIQVYVVGYYVATADIAALQNALVKKINPIATTLVPGEREELRAALLDPAASEKTWDELLAHGVPARSAFRVIPVRDTDFHHLRDGFVRAIQARAPALSGQGVDDDAFGEAMRQFRGVFNRGSVPKQKELLLVRDETGRLSIAYDAGASKKEGRVAGRQLIGVVEDERVSRALWLNYLGGKKVASEPARKSIVEGIMEFVERPVGTVATQVVPVVNTKV